MRQAGKDLPAPVGPISSVGALEYVTVTDGDGRWRELHNTLNDGAVAEQHCRH